MESNSNSCNSVGIQGDLHRERIQQPESHSNRKLHSRILEGPVIREVFLQVAGTTALGLGSGAVFLVLGRRLARTRGQGAGAQSGFFCRTKTISECSELPRSKKEKLDFTHWTALELLTSLLP